MLIKVFMMVPPIERPERMRKAWIIGIIVALALCAGLGGCTVYYTWWIVNEINSPPFHMNERSE